MNDRTCSDCIFFDYEESFDGEEETEYFTCKKGHDDHIGWNTPPCEDFRETE